MSRAPNTPESITFGRFRILPLRRALLAGDAPIKLGARAFDLLMVLIEASGAIVSKDELMARVWPGRVVDENNLQTQILALRRALGAAERDLIRTVAGRGYQFTGEIHIVSPGPEKPVAERPPVAAGEAIAASNATAAPTNLPQPVSELIGRDAEVEEVSTLVRARRLVTLAGAGGIGKTRLALAVGRRLLPHFPDGVWLAEFSPLSDPSLVPATVAAAAGLELGGGELSARRVAQALAARRLLVVMDTCEHVIDAAASMAEALLQAGSAVHVIATSREPLRAEGERLYQVPSLAVPTEDANDLFDYGAVRLFVDRARAAEPDLEPNRLRAPIIAAICRRLDGIPLAIEMAAARVAALGVGELARRLDDRLQLLTGGRRTALPRHQTLRATLDWSHGLLAEPERVVLRRLAIFAGSFTLEAAGVVAVGPDLARPDAIEALLSLVGKSLVASDVESAVARYRLLDTTRAYALEKLGENGERDSLARRHAEYYRDLFEQAKAEQPARPISRALADDSHRLDNLRAALDWAFSPKGDASIGVALTAAAVPLWVQFSLISECRRWVESALASLGSEAGQNARQAMQLYAALGLSLLFTAGAVRATGTALTKALAIAECLNDTDFRLRLLWGLWADRLNNGEFRATLTLAKRFRELAVASSDPNDIPIGDRLIGFSLHFLGDQAGARRHIETMLDHYVPPDREMHVVRFQFDQRVMARVGLARILWLLGFPDQAMHAANEVVEDALSMDHEISLCNALIQAACPLSFLTGDLDAAAGYITMLVQHAESRGLDVWRRCGDCFSGQLLIARGDLLDGLRILDNAIDELSAAGFTQYHGGFLATLANGLAQADRIEEGVAVIDKALARANQVEERWCMAELLRTRGELLCRANGADAVMLAEAQFQDSLDWARRQGALSWELRSATSVARSLRDQGRSADGIAILQPIYDRFTEGFDTADLKAAKALLHDLP